MDDSLIRDHAQQRSLSFRWRTWSEGERAFARIEIWHEGKKIYAIGSNGLTSEQDVLDLVMGWAIKHTGGEAKHGTLAGWSHSLGIGQKKVPANGLKKRGL